MTVDRGVTVRRRWARRAAGPVLAVGALLVFAGPVAADPVGPTDYRSEVIELVPSVPGVEVGIVGGDSFVELRADPGVEVVVVGYRGEPYLRFEVDGTVRRNERSPSRWQNDDRYAAVELPPAADADADPEWVDVAGDGLYAWHDHRAHWMNPTRPPGAEPGDTILEAVIPLAVDGIDVEVHVRSTLLAGPSPLAPILGGLAGLGVGLAALLTGRGAGETRPRSLWPLASALVGWAAAATVVAAVGARGFPPEATPGPALWAVPAVAGLVVVVGMVIEGRGLLSPPLRALVGPAMLALAGLELLSWVWLRREALARALIPGDAPDWLDRAVIAGAGTLGLVALGGAVLLLRERRPSLRPRR